MQHRSIPGNYRLWPRRHWLIRSMYVQVARQASFLSSGLVLVVERRAAFPEFQVADPVVYPAVFRKWVVHHRVAAKFRVESIEIRVRFAELRVASAKLRVESVEFQVESFEGA